MTRRAVALGLVALVAVFALGLARGGVAAYRVRGGSMAPALRDGDRVVAIRRTEVRRLDVVVLESPHGDVLVKRIVGLPGEIVEVRAGRLVVDGRQVDVPGAAAPCPDDDAAAVRLARDQYYVLSDARDGLDSRAFGPVAARTIRGVVLLRAWPFGG